MNSHSSGTDEALIRSEFLQLSLSLSATSQTAEEWVQQIVSRYSETQRHYHTLSHISSMIGLLNNYKDHFNNIPAVMLAIFFHDIIYEPTAKNNETQSAECFKSFAGHVNLPLDLVCIVVECIERTITHTPSDGSFKMKRETNSDLCLFLDLDLEVLGRGPLEYNAYAAQIKREYCHFSDRDYFAGRIKVLESFLQRERLYFSNVFYERYEAQARSNITNEIKTLKGMIEVSQAVD